MLKLLKTLIILILLLHLPNCATKQKIIVISDFCENIYEEPETNKVSIPAQNYWHNIEIKINQKKINGEQLSPAEELINALIMTIGKYESKHSELCK